MTNDEYIEAVRAGIAATGKWNRVEVVSVKDGFFSIRATTDNLHDMLSVHYLLTGSQIKNGVSLLEAHGPVDAQVEEFKRQSEAQPAHG